MAKIKLLGQQSRGSSGGRATSDQPIVGVLGGSKSDFPILEKTGAILAQLGIPYELLVVSAHRTPDRLFEYATTASGRGIQVIIGGAGGAAHLPGMLAAKTHLPVIGVPIPTENLRFRETSLTFKVSENAEKEEEVKRLFNYEYPQLVKTMGTFSLTVEVWYSFFVSFVVLLLC